MHRSKIYEYLSGFPHNAPTALKHVGIKQGYHSHPFVCACTVFILTIVEQFKIYVEFYIGEF